MPYEIKPASGIFLRFIENKLSNIPCTVVKINHWKERRRAFKKHGKSIGNFE